MNVVKRATNNFLSSLAAFKNTLNKIFFGIKGNSFNGNDFADEAIKNGAKIAIVQNIRKSSKKKN